MRKIAAGLFISLDGVVEFPERWGFQYMNREITERIVAGIAQADAVLLGPETYRLFSRLWSNQKDDVPMAKFLNHSHKYVASRTPDKVGGLEWGPATLLEGGLVAALEKIRSEPGKTIQVPGSPRLVGSLLREGLLGELSLTICPEIVGSGKRLFDGLPDPIRLAVEETFVSGNGALSATYRPVRSNDHKLAQPLRFTAAVGGR